MASLDDVNLSFNGWLSDQGLATITDGTTQSYFAVHYTAWLTEIFNTTEVRQYLLEEHGIALDSTLVVKLNQNSEDGAPYVEVDGVAHDVFGDFFSDRTDVDLKTGKVTQERWYSDTFSFGDTNQAPTDIRLTIDPDFADVVAGVSGSPSSSGNTTTGEGPLVIGTLSATDPDAGDTHNFEIVSDPTGRFEIVNDNQLQLAEGEDISQGDGNFTVTVKVTDSAGNEYFETFSFTAGTDGANSIAGADAGGDGSEATPVVGDDVIFGFVQNDTLGTALTGTSGDDALFGGLGTDTLYGGMGDDQLFGGRNGDTLVGGQGADILSGGHGDDEFVWLGGDMADTSDENFDVITDWSDGDTLNVADLLDSFGYDSNTDALADWVQLDVGATDTVVQVNTDGAGAWANLVTLQGITDATLGTEANNAIV